MKIREIIINRYNYETKYQRNGDAWSLALKKRLIDSILNNYYIPEIIVANNEIVDGKQRMTAINEFLLNKFQIEYKGKKVYYKDLSSSEKIVIDYFDISVKNLGQMDDNKILEMFLRINKGSVKLSTVEMLLAESLEENRNILNKLVKKGSIQKISNQKKKDKRFTIQELIIRIMSIIEIQETTQKGSARSNMKNVLKKPLDKDFVNRFEVIMDLMYEILGLDTIFNKSFNTLYESIFIAFYNNFDNKSVFKYQKEKLKLELFNVQNEISNNQMGGGNKYDDYKHIKQRIIMVDKILQNYVKDKKRLFSYDEKLLLWNNNPHKCNNCNKIFKKINEFEGDHILAHGNGGLTSLENAQMLCKTCNLSKSNKQ